MTGFFALLRLQLLSRFADLKPKNLKKAFAENRAMIQAPSEMYVQADGKTAGFSAGTGGT